MNKKTILFSLYIIHNYTLPEATNNTHKKLEIPPITEQKITFQQLPETSHKELFEIEHTTSSITDDSINLNHWGATGQLYSEDKKVYYGTFETRFGDIKLERSFSTTTKHTLLTQGPS